MCLQMLNDLHWGEGEGGIRHTKIQHKNNQDICAAQHFSSKLGIVMALARNVVSGSRKYLAKKTTTKTFLKGQIPERIHLEGQYHVL